MRLPKIARLPAALLLLAGLTLTLAPQLLQPTPASANTITYPNPAPTPVSLNTLTICGAVSGYLAPGFTNGYIIINGVTYSIEPWAVITNKSLIASGGVICLQATFDSSGAIDSAVVTTGAAPPLSFCGTVGTFLVPTAVAPGYVVVNNTTFPIAPGIVLAGWGYVNTNALICLAGSLNPYGQIVYGSITVGTPGNTYPFRVCGIVSIFVPSSPFTAGTITINGRNFGIAPSIFWTTPGNLTVGSDICISGLVNGIGQIVSASIGPDVPTTVPVIACGTITLYSPATALQTGVITIGGTSYVIANNAGIAGGELAVQGANVCISGTTGPLGQLLTVSFTVNGPTTPPPSNQALNVCGVVTDFTPATSVGNGVLSLGGKTFTVAAGTAVSGASLLTSGTNVCVVGTVNSAGQVSAATVTLNGSLQVNVCGLVSSYSTPSATLAGSLVIAGITFPVAAGATFPSGITFNTTVSATFTFNGQGQITAMAVGSGTCTGNTISGMISAYVAPTATTVGSITIGGATYPVAVGTVLTINNGPPLAATPYHRGKHPVKGF